MNWEVRTNHGTRHGSTGETTGDIARVDTTPSGVIPLPWGCSYFGEPPDIEGLYGGLMSPDFSLPVTPI